MESKLRNEIRKMIAENLMGSSSGGPMTIGQVLDYCDELISADLIDQDNAYSLDKAATQLNKAVERVHFILDEMRGADLLPDSDESGLPDIDDVLRSLKT